MRRAWWSLGEVQHLRHKGSQCLPSFPSPFLQTGATTDAQLDETAAAETTSILNSINERSTLVEDLKSCGTTRNVDRDGRQISTQITIIQIRSVQILLSLLTFCCQVLHILVCLVARTSD
jgi:hypothetical protein